MHSFSFGNSNIAARRQLGNSCTVSSPAHVCGRATRKYCCCMSWDPSRVPSTYFWRGTYWLNDCMIRCFCIVLCCRYPLDTLKVYFDFIIPHLIKCSHTTVFTHSLIVMPVCRHPSVGIMVQSQSGYTERMSEFNISSTNSIILSNWVRLSKSSTWFDLIELRLCAHAASSFHMFW